MSSKKAAQDPVTPETILTIFDDRADKPEPEVSDREALIMLSRIRPDNEVTVAEFLYGLKKHGAIWGVVGTMGIVDFADAINGGHTEHEEPYQRTRITNAQMDQLKELALKVLQANPEGLSRRRMARVVDQEDCDAIGVPRKDLAAKLRQPLHQLVRDGVLATQGLKRSMVYVIKAASIPRKPRRRPDEARGREAP